MTHDNIDASNDGAGAGKTGHMLVQQFLLHTLRLLLMFGFLFQIAILLFVLFLLPYVTSLLMRR